MTKVKICGLRNRHDIQVVEQAGADFAGFIMTASRRQISIDEAGKLILMLNRGIQSVAVYRNEPVSQIIREQALIGFSVVQLHTKPDKQRIHQLRHQLPPAVRIWQCVQVPSDVTATLRDLSVINQLNEITECPSAPDGLLFDSSAGHSSGGTGETFSWHGFRSLYDQFKLPGLMIAAGGLDVNNVKEAINSLQPDVVDCSSGVEKNGSKDKCLTAEFCGRVKQISRQEA